MGLYIRPFLADNTLNQEQIDAIQATKDFYHEVGSLDGTELQIELLDNFDFETTAILKGNLPNTGTEGRWWCWRGTLIDPCHMEYRDGQPIGFYETYTMTRRGIFGIRGRTERNVIIPC